MKFDYDSYKKTSTAISESVGRMKCINPNTYNDKVMESFKKYINFCESRAAEVEKATKDICNIFSDLNSIDAESILRDSDE